MDTWANAVPLIRSGYHERLIRRVDTLRQSAEIYPPPGMVLRALQATSFAGVKVVILGQDPYHGPGQANGLAFSVPNGVKTPPSLRNIYRELREDVYGGEEQALPTDLRHWAEQGVLLLNAILTVERGKPGSHKDLGWSALTDQVIECLGRDRDHLVYMLWGSFARSKLPLLDPVRHLILEAPHPSPLSAYRGFFGCRHFSTANHYLARHEREPIRW